MGTLVNQSSRLLNEPEHMDFFKSSLPTLPLEEYICLGIEIRILGLLGLSTTQDYSIHLSFTGRTEATDNLYFGITTAPDIVLEGLYRVFLRTSLSKLTHSS